MNNDDDEMELIRQNDQAVVQNKVQSCSNEFDVPKYNTVLANHNYNYYRQQEEQNLFMQDDEMTSWLHYPFPDTNFCNNFSEDDLLYPSSSTVFTDTMMTKCETMVTSFSGDVTPALIPQKPCVVDNQKRKGKEKVLESHTQLESAETKKPVHGSKPKKRSRAAEVHNQSERRRRDRINQKLTALRELLPCSNKLDKASMLEYAIEYLKSLQMQVQMMSMAYNVVPVIFPGMQHFEPLVLMGMNSPILPLPNFLTGESLSTPPAVATTICPRFSMSPYQIPPITSPNSSTTQSSSVSIC